MSTRIETVNNNQTNVQQNPVKKGAKIGAGVSLGLIGLNAARDILKKDSFIKENFNTISDAAKKCGAGKKEKALMFGVAALAHGIVITGLTTIAAGIGAGIGKLIEMNNNRKENQKQEIVEQVKAELIEE